MISSEIYTNWIQIGYKLDKNKMNLGTFCENEKFYDFSLIFRYVAVAAHAVALILAFFADFWQAQYS